MNTKPIISKITEEASKTGGTVPFTVLLEYAIDLDNKEIAEVEAGLVDNGIKLVLSPRPAKDELSKDKIKALNIECLLALHHPDPEVVDEANNRLGEYNQGLVMDRVKKLVSANDPDFEDFISEGNIGLLKAISGYQFNKGAVFSSYATDTIEGYILKRLYKNRLGLTYVPGEQNDFSDIRKIIAELKKDDKNISYENVSGLYKEIKGKKLSEESYNAFVALQDCMSLDETITPVDDGKDMSNYDKIPSTVNTPEETTELAEEEKQARSKLDAVFSEMFEKHGTTQTLVAFSIPGVWKNELNSHTNTLCAGLPMFERIIAKLYDQSVLIFSSAKLVTVRFSQDELEKIHDQILSERLLFLKLLRNISFESQVLLVDDLKNSYPEDLERIAEYLYVPVLSPDKAPSADDIAMLLGMRQEEINGIKNEAVDNLRNEALEAGLDGQN